MIHINPFSRRGDARISILLHCTFLCASKICITQWRDWKCPKNALAAGRSLFARHRLARTDFDPRAGSRQRPSAPRRVNRRPVTENAKTKLVRGQLSAAVTCKTVCRSPQIGNRQAVKWRVNRAHITRTKGPGSAQTAPSRVRPRRKVSKKISNRSRFDSTLRGTLLQPANNARRRAEKILRQAGSRNNGNFRRKYKLEQISERSGIETH